MKNFIPFVPYLAGWCLLLLSASLYPISLLNGVLQLILFLFVVCIPIWRTGRMSYVDIAWPWGLVLIGILTFIFSDGYGPRVVVVSMAYIFAGARMGLGALKMWKLGYLKKEFPRYEYQKIRWEKAGKTNIPLAMQVEALVQGLANAAFLAFPAFIIASNSSAEFSLLEIIGLVVWIGAFVMESVADAQKLKFLQKKRQAGEKNTVCNVGLWRYSRHPNYFAEWMVWNGLVIAAIPSWLALYGSETMVIWMLLAAGLFFTSRFMYSTLVYYTGAVPAEHYSVLKRSAYKDYQASTNMFFPGRPKNNN
ncbi:MAG: steroid 5-alpha reductase family enzyme [Paraglaciecola sp.]|jgi:steroid 5-alpha reductase family enzyme